MHRSMGMDWLKKYALHILMAIIIVWLFSISTALRQLENRLEDWSQHIAQKVARAENMANQKYEADLETLEVMFEMIYRLKQMTEEEGKAND